MAHKVGDIVKALCSHCRVTVDAQVDAAVGDEIVTVTCRTCGTSQRYQDESDDGQSSTDGRATLGRRVVDVDPPRRKKARAGQRRVQSTTGREIPDSPRPIANARSFEPPPVRPDPTGQTGSGTPIVLGRDSPHFKRWNEATDKIDSRYARPHRSHEAYEVGEAVLHKVHGMGIIEKVAADGDLSVLFRNGFVTLPSRPKSELPPRASVPDEDDDG
ncbi:MAG: hypothetical protein KC635_00465 [Myxococcales bacterium]|nr:hypothetical protein [Myxococcales bacterium]MCB9733769.1 hypothetical protein [Deltaproteobacteria bacterium]